jgi:hypothetical protein
LYGDEWDDDDNDHTIPPHIIKDTNTTKPIVGMRRDIGLWGLLWVVDMRSWELSQDGRKKWYLFFKAD